MNMIIQSTTDYSQFKTISGNRGIQPTNLKKIESSIAVRNLLAVNPIIVNSKKEVIDGQHRLEAAKRLKVPIFYVVNDNVGIEEVVQLNTNQAQWTMMDYVNSYAARGIEDYKTLQKFINHYGFPTSTAIVLLGSGGAKTSGGTHRAFKAGNFKVKSENEAIELAESLEQLKPYVMYPPIVRSVPFIAAISKVLKIVRLDELIEKFESSGRRIERRGNVTLDYLRQLEDVYNYNRSKRFRFY